MDWFIGCTHFGHDKIRQLSRRPFDNVEDMNKTMIDNINTRCSTPGDILWVLGDFCFGKPQNLRDIMNQINVKDIRLIMGNHDKMNEAAYLTAGFQCVYQVHELKRTLNDGVTMKKIVLFHFPIEDWNARYHDSWHLHSHVHGHMNIPGEEPGITGRFRLDVGVDSHNFCPLSFDQIERMFQRSSICQSPL